ncbi:MAG: TIR domain-containing protein [Bacillota bacterium]|nr:TIR domain-containing protein [Bacillota bacterium]
MGRKVFVSYKYADDQVENLTLFAESTVRDYVTEFEKRMDESDHIYKGEREDDDISNLSEDVIWQKLRDRIYDSTLTVVFISPGMKEPGKDDKDQWIPWEVSYSLKETSRKNKNGDAITSKTNAMIAVVLPDICGSYSYYLEDKTCCNSACVTHHTEKLFNIIKDNKFNIKDPDKGTCNAGTTVWRGEVSYIEAVKWKDFIADYNEYFDRAYNRQDNINNYKIEKSLS